MKLKTSFRRKAISPLIATLILIAITIVGGVVVYRAFFSNAATVSANLHATITDASISGSGTGALTVKNDGTNSWTLASGSTDIKAFDTTTASAMDCTFTVVDSPLSPGQSTAVTGTGCTTAAGHAYIITVIVHGQNPTGSIQTTFNGIATP